MTIDNLSNQELSAKVEDALECLHHMPSDLSWDDKQLLKEMKKRFDTLIAPGFLDSDDELLAALDEVIIYTQTSNEIQVLGKVRDRLFGQTVGKSSVDESIISGLKEIISYPGNLSDANVRTLEEVLAYINCCGYDPVKI